ncbi:MAG: hypothetical protein ACLUV3_12825 [Oscillospiraceae bacterium]
MVEKEHTLKTAFALSEILSKYGVDFKLSRTQDIDTDMDSKVAMCNKYAPDSGYSFQRRWRTGL